MTKNFKKGDVVVTIVGNGRSVSGSRKINIGANAKKAHFRRHPVEGIPKVLQSVIGDATPDGVIVFWDRPMEITCDPKTQFTVLVDGVPDPVTEISFHPTDKKIMAIIVSKVFHQGEVVTWAYDETGTCELRQSQLPNTEAPNGTNIVVNDIRSMTADSTVVTADSTKITADRT